MTVHTARMLLRDVTAKDKERMLDKHTLPAARTLATLEPHLTVFGCTSASALRGHAADHELTQQISDINESPTLSVIQAVRTALRPLGARRIAVATPYTDVLTEHVVASLEDVAEIVGVASLGLVDNRAIGDTTPERIADFVVTKLGGAGADAIFISSTNFRAVETLERVASAVGVPGVGVVAAAGPDPGECVGWRGDVAWFDSHDTTSAWLRGWLWTSMRQMLSLSSVTSMV